jgi:hypothetical protein
LTSSIARVPQRTPPIGAILTIVLFALVVAIERGALPAPVGHGFSLVVVIAGVAWCLRGSGRMRRLCELYVWLAFILSIYHFQVMAEFLARWTGFAVIDVFRVIAVAHLTIVGAALGVLVKAAAGQTPGLRASRLAAVLFIAGAAVFWIGARTFPGMTLEVIQANPTGHLWTSVSFFIAAVITIAGLAVFTVALREAGDRLASGLGLLLFAFGSVFWALHLAFRLTVMVDAAEEWKLTAATPPWFEAWRSWAALLFAFYSVLAYVGLALYGAALLNTSWLPRWVGWSCVVAGALAVPLGGLPLFVHVPLWLAGIAELSRAGDGVRSLHPRSDLTP